MRRTSRRTGLRQAIDPHAPRACVIGDMDLVRPLALAGIRSVVAAPATSPLRFSRYTEAALRPADDWLEEDAVLDELMRYGLAQPSRPVLFYQTTPALLMISRHRDRLSTAFRFLIADAALIEQLTDKAAFHELADRLGLPVPFTQHLRPAQEPVPPSDLEYPLLIKPVVRRFDQWGSIRPDAKALTIGSKAELRALWPEMAAVGVEILAQELIVGPESQIESYHTYVDNDGGVVADFTGVKIRTRPAQFGYSTALITTDAPDVAALGRTVVEQLGLTGVAKLDFKRRPDGALQLLEVNPRFTLWHHPAAVGGLNVPHLVFADLTGERRPPILAPAPTRWCDTWEDAAAARQMGQLNVDWLRATALAAKSGLSLDDPLPFVRGVAIDRLRQHARRRLLRFRTVMTRGRVHVTRADYERSEGRKL